MSEWFSKWIDYCSDVLHVSDASSGDLAQAQSAFKYAYQKGIEDAREKDREACARRFEIDDPVPSRGGIYDSSWYQKMPS